MNYNTINSSRGISYYKIRNWYANLVKVKPKKPPYTHVVQIGDPVLRFRSNPVPENLIQSADIAKLLHHMKHVYNKYNCVGLAAPQIGVPLRIILFGLNKKQLKEFSKEEIKMKEMETLPASLGHECREKFLLPKLQFIINPEITITNYDKMVFTESCESVRGFHADVPRFYSLQLKGLDENGRKKEISAKGWLSRIIQHEMDHLNGKMYTDIMDRKTLTCGCWDVVNEKNGGVNLSYGTG